VSSQATMGRKKKNGRSGSGNPENGTTFPRKCVGHKVKCILRQKGLKENVNRGEERRTRPPTTEFAGSRKGKGCYWKQSKRKVTNFPEDTRGGG